MPPVASNSARRTLKRNRARFSDRALFVVGWGRQAQRHAHFPRRSDFEKNKKNNILKDI
jgi:hypothetical protein